MKTTKLLTLENERISVGILPHVGGRVVRMCRPGKKNILKSDPDLWQLPNSSSSRLSPRTPWRAYCGHIVWLGPQREWWTHQSAAPGRKQKHAGWPPDPYWEFAAYTVVKQTSTSVTMSGPASPFTGIQLTKTISLSKSGKVTFTVVGVNASRKNVAWDLWLNTRMDGYARCYVPLAAGDVPRVFGKTTRSLDKMHWAVHDKLFTFVPAKTSPGKKMRWGKAFLFPPKPCMVGIDGRQALVISFERFPSAAIHPKQALVEIFNSTMSNGDTLLELEHHAPYCTLKPGQSMQAQETWELLEYNGGTDVSAQVAFVKKILKSK